MRRNGRILLLILVAILGSSCEDLLIIKPTDTKIEEDAIQTATDVQNLLNGAYDVLRNDNLMGSNNWLANELLSDNIDPEGISGNLLAVYNRNTTIFNNVSRQLWNQSYTCIYRCNLVLKYVEKINGIKPEDKARMRGQALFLRAYCNFELVKLFAQPYGYTADNSHNGIPLRLTTEITTIGRSKVSEVYDQIISDLNFAVQELPADLVPGTPNVWAAKAMLAKVYFQRNDFFFALKYAKDVVENSTAIFQNNLQLRFSNSQNTDNIFELLSDGSGPTGQQAGAQISAMYRSNTAEPQLLYTADFYNELKRDAGEKRLLDWCKVEPASGSNPEEYYPTKLNYDVRFRIPLIHMAELKLIYAESAVEQGDLNAGKIQLNDVRLRAGLNKFVSSSATQIIDEIRHQRRLEMVLEGNRVQDLKRIAIREGGATSFHIRGSAWNCPGLVLAIPDDEMSANPKMIQNPLGGCN